MAFVYLLCDPSKDYSFKIGITKGCIKKRIKQLQTGNSEEIHLVDYFETKYPFFIERSLHMFFNNKKILNEWFDLNSPEVSSFKELCEKYEKIAESLKDNHFSKNILK